MLAVAALAGCGGHATPKQSPPPAPVLSTLLAREKSVHFLLDGTVKIDLPSLLGLVHPLAPIRIRASGDASRRGAKAAGTLHGALGGSGRVVVAGKAGYVQVGGTWYTLGRIRTVRELLRHARWTVERASGGRPQTLHGRLHLSRGQLGQLWGAGLPFGVDGADMSITIHLSRWGEPVTVKAPHAAGPLSQRLGAHSPTA